MHLDDEHVQRLLHGELPPESDASAREHLGTCAPCRDRVALAEQEEDAVHMLLRELDHEPPVIRAGSLLARAARAGATPAARSAWRRRAAGLLVALGVAGAAYAIPGSPLPAWLDAVVARIAPAPRGPVAPPQAEPEPVAPATGGIALAPGKSLRIEFTQPQTTGRVEISLTDSALVLVRTVPGAATFTSEVDRLVIDNTASSASFEIQIPRDAPRVEILVVGNRVFLKEGSRILTAAADFRGSYVLPLGP